jgi:hypothetical protein
MWGCLRNSLPVAIHAERWKKDVRNQSVMVPSELEKLDVWRAPRAPDLGLMRFAG